MTRHISSVTGIIGAAALVLAGATVDLHAQRGASAGHGRPATAGVQAQGHGRPDNPGAQGQGHRPETPGDKSNKGATGTTGQRTAADQLTHNTNLMTRLQALFPKDTDLTKEATNFRNLGQFVAAAHVSHNLDIPWADLKAKMTGDHPVSLGKAIEELKPQSNAKTEASKAEKEANEDLKESGKTKNSTAS